MGAASWKRIFEKWTKTSSPPGSFRAHDGRGLMETNVIPFFRRPVPHLFRAHDGRGLMETGMPSDERKWSFVDSSARTMGAASWKRDTPPHLVETSLVHFRAHDGRGLMETPCGDFLTDGFHRPFRAHDGRGLMETP